MREFIRHPAEIPIEITADDRRVPISPQMSNVSYGGLAFHSERELSPGSLVRVTIPLVEPAFAATARVIWCVSGVDGYEVGVQFKDMEDAFCARMVEQVCHIEYYRRQALSSEGRVLTPEQAAMEWIGKHAAQFDNPEETLSRRRS
jgi:hypothetical protein